jgi:hypothetical protein
LASGAANPSTSWVSSAVPDWHGAVAARADHRSYAVGVRRPQRRSAVGDPRPVEARQLRSDDRTVGHDEQISRCWSLRQRRPGVWELRVALGPDLVSGRSLVRSVTMHGDRDDAQGALARWAAQADAVRAGRRAAPGIPVADLLDRWVATAHGWRPATLVGYVSTVRALRGAPIGARPASQVTPSVLRAMVQDWPRRG